MRSCLPVPPPPPLASSVSEPPTDRFGSFFPPPLPSSSSAHAYYAPPPSSDSSTSQLPSTAMSDYASHHAHPSDLDPLSDPILYHSSSTKLNTPPPLFDPSEQDLFSSFLNIFGDSNGEWDFDPQGMPDDMPVLGELKRRLDQADAPLVSSSTMMGVGEEMGREVEHRLKISEPEPSPTLSHRPASHSPTHTRVSPGSRPLAAVAHPSKQEPQEEGGRKKAKLKPSSLYLPSSRPTPPPPHLPQGEDIEMAQPKDDRPCATVADEEEPKPMKEESKPPKPTHLVSEQRRRNAIQGGFGNLVEILRAGESISGLSIGLMANESNESEKGSPLKPHPKLPSRGRGRRGEVETGASKSVVLERAVDYVKWITLGNTALKSEVERVEGLLRRHGVQVWSTLKKKRKRDKIFLFPSYFFFSLWL